MLFLSLTYILKYTNYKHPMQDLRTKIHVVYSLHLHLVFATKYRKKVFTEKMYGRLHFHFDRVCKDFRCKLVETNGERDHVHLLIDPLPHTTPSKLVNSLKGVSSRFANASPSGFSGKNSKNWNSTTGRVDYGLQAILSLHVVEHRLRLSKSISKISKFVLISSP